MKVFATAVLMFCVTLAAGCGSAGPDDSPDGLVRQSIAAMNEMVDGMEAGKTKEELSSVDAKLKSVNEKIKALRLTKKETDALIEKHKTELDKAGARMVSAMMGAQMETMDSAIGDLNSNMRDGMQNMTEQMGQQMKNMQDKMNLPQ